MLAVTMFRLLGPFEVVRDGQPIDLGGPRQRSVLAMLLLDAGRVVSTDRLVENLWGADPPPSMLGSLQVYISNIRRALRDEERATSPVVRQAPGYLVDVDPADIDLTPFELGCEAALTAAVDRDWAAAVESSRSALRHVRGPLLADFGDEEWVRVRAVAIDERRRACEQALATGLLGLGRVADALAVSGRLVVEQPLAERSCWLHMIGLYRAGLIGEALAAYREHVRALDDDLGLDPGPALRDLHAAILRQDRELERWPQAHEQVHVPGIVQPEPAAPGPAPPELAGRVFVGRDRELAILVELLEQARHVGTRWIVLTGPAGIGKTRLTEEAAASWAADGGQVCRARCPDDEGVPPWWPLRQVLRALGHDPTAVLRVTEGSHADTARYEAYDRVVDVLMAAAAARPLLVLVDDVQWADPMSLRFLTHLLDTVDIPGLALALTARDVRPSRDLTRLLGGIARRSGTRQLTLPPLSSDEVAELAAAVRGHDIDVADARRLMVRTGGNPFFVCEYARLTDEQLAAGETPNAIRSVLRLRLSGLDADVLAVLEAAAVSGSVLDIHLLCAVVGQGRDALADRLDDAADVHLLVVDPVTGAYAFPHALLRDEILAGLSPARRGRLNLAVAEALGEAPVGEALGKRAAHLVAALPLADARTALAACRAAALDAEQAWQSEAAAGWWELALHALDRTTDATSTERDDLTVALVAAFARSGRSQTVLDTVDAALLDAVRAGRTASAGRLAAVLLRTSGSWPWVVYGDDAGPLLARLDGLADHVTADPAARARILAALAVGRSYDREQERDRPGRAAIDIAERLGDPEVLADALLGRALSICAIAVHANEVIAILGRLATLPHAYAQVDAVIAQGILFNARMALGDPACADHVRIGATGSDMLRLPISRMQMRWAEAQLHHWRGDDLATAESLYEQAMAAHRRTELYESSVLDIARLTLRWDQGRLAEFPELADVDAQVLPWARAMVAVATDADDADDLVRAGAARATPRNWMQAAELTMGAHAVADRGMRELTATLRARLEPLAGYIANIGLVGTMGPVALGLARLCVLDGDLDAAQRHLATARQISERAGGRLSVLRTRLVAAELAADTGSFDIDELTEIAHEAASRGLLGVERRARGLLDAHATSA